MAVLNFTKTTLHKIEQILKNKIILFATKKETFKADIVLSKVIKL